MPGVVSLVVGIAGWGDAPVQHGVDGGEGDEGYECHDEEVGEENISLDVERTVPHFCDANRILDWRYVFNIRGVGPEGERQGTDWNRFIASFDTSVQLIPSKIFIELLIVNLNYHWCNKPWNVPNKTQENCRKNVEPAWETWKPKYRITKY